MPTSVADPITHLRNFFFHFPLNLAVSSSAATQVCILADGGAMLHAELRPSETRQFAAKQQFQVTTTDSSAVLLELNGCALPPVKLPEPPVQ